MTSTLSGALALRRATARDAATLAALASVTFVETFAADNDPADMAAYVAHAFGESIQRGELLDPRTIVLLAEHDGRAVGYAMLRDDEPPACVAARDALEIARLYVSRDLLGAGVGSALMRACLAHAAAHGHTAVWLGVWERNARAIAFYRRWSFRDVGMQHFQLGGDRQVDRVMTRSVQETS